MRDVSDESNWDVEQGLPLQTDKLNLNDRKKVILEAFPELNGCQTVETLVNIADGVLENNYFQEKKAGGRKMLCTKTADILKVLADISGNWGTDFPEISQLNVLRGIEFNNSFFDHTPVVLTNMVNGKKYIVDLTFSQFVDPLTQNIVYKNCNGEVIDTGVDVRTNSVASELLDKGFVGFDLITDYLNLTVKPEARKEENSEFWSANYGQLDMESFSSDSDIDSGCKELEKYLKEVEQRKLDEVNESVLESKLMKHLIGIDWDDPKLFDRLIEDKNIVRKKYGLPPEEMRDSDQREYFNWLKDIANKNGLMIRPREWDKKFFEDNPEAVAKLDGETNTIVVDINFDDSERTRMGLRLLEHELVHGLQRKKYSRMPIEIMEYEANLVEKNLNFYKNFPDGGKLVAEEIWGSVKNWYERNPEQEIKWNNLDD